MAYVDRSSQFRFSMTAFVFTGPGTNSAENPRQDISPLINFIGTGISIFKETSNIGRNIRAGRAGTLTGNIDIHVEKIFRR
jgi:hypothetical protein